MNDYIGKICPYCRTELKASDEVVVCSGCEMPHHKDCWIENRGCTTFGCTGTIQGVSGAVGAFSPTPQASQNTSVPEFIFCRKCGQRGRRTDIFCSKCGTRHIIPAAPTDSRDPVPLVTKAGIPAYAGVPAHPTGQTGGGAPSSPSVPAYSAASSTSAAPAYSASSSTPSVSSYSAGAGYTPAPAPSHATPLYSTPGIYPSPSSPIPPASAPSSVPYSGPSSGPSSGPYSGGTPLNSDDHVEESLFIDTNVPFYRRKFDTMERSGTAASWNWCAFLFAPYWFLYRKMYVIGSAIAAVTVLCTLIDYTDLVVLAMAVTSGILGNFLYKRHMTGKLAKMRSLTPEARHVAVIKIGGTNIAACILGFVAVIFTSVMLYGLINGF